MTARAPRMLAAAALVLASVATPAFAQQAALQITQGPYHSGVPIDLQVVAEGFEEEPAPEVTGDPPTGSTLNFVQSRPQVSSMMQIINGRVTQSRTVRFAYVYQLTAPKAGRYTLGPFTVTQGAKTAVTRAVTVTVADVPQAGGQRLRVVLPDGPIYVGQRVPVTVEWWTESGLADRLFDQRLNVPLFMDTANFQFLDEEREPTRITITADTPGGAAEFPAEVTQRSQDGKTWVIRSFTRTLVPVATGRFDLGQPVLFCEEATAFRRDIFGSRVPSNTRRVRVTAAPLVLDVQTVPSQGRPASFAGAIGQGFTMDVAADRTVLQTGDPVKLTITIHGDGSLDAASLPPLASAGLSPQRFRLPDGQVAGITDERGKRFEVTVRVIDPAVREIPPVEYSWFDPTTGRFETTRSQPIALSVRGATMVGAGDVVSAAPSDPPPPDAAQPPDVPGRAATFTLTGADLSIETDVSRLRASATSPLGSPVVVWTGYTGGILALVAGFFVRRRRDIDPVKAKHLKELRALRSRVASERSSRDVAAALRKMASLRGDVKTRAAGVDDVLARLDEMAYAPGGESATIPPQLRSAAVAAADGIVEEAR
ncbi:MAG: BatD family protein [Candidatus Binatia bacterium]